MLQDEGSQTSVAADHLTLDSYELRGLQPTDRPDLYFLYGFFPQQNHFC